MQAGPNLIDSISDSANGNVASREMRIKVL
jgi:hypothetical protein